MHLRFEGSEFNDQTLVAGTIGVLINFRIRISEEF